MFWPCHPNEIDSMLFNVLHTCYDLITAQNPSICSLSCITKNIWQIDHRIGWNELFPFVRLFRREKYTHTHTHSNERITQKEIIKFVNLNTHISFTTKFTQIFTHRCKSFKSRKWNQSQSMQKVNSFVALDFEAQSVSLRWTDKMLHARRLVAEWRFKHIHELKTEEQSNTVLCACVFFVYTNGAQVACHII